MLLPLLLLLMSASPFASGDGCAGARCCRSALGAVRLGGPMAEVEDGDGVMSIGSRGGASEELELDEGRMGIDLCMFGLWSPENGLRRASATEAMVVMVWSTQRTGRPQCNVEVLGCGVWAVEGGRWAVGC